MAASAVAAPESRVRMRREWGRTVPVYPVAQAHVAASLQIPWLFVAPRPNDCKYGTTFVSKSYCCAPRLNDASEN